MNLNNFQHKLALLLRQINSPASIQKAEEIENSSTVGSCLHLRSLGLTSAEILEVLALLEEENTDSIKSISFSYNQLGDRGAIALADSLPTSLNELGLVDCGIEEKGGKALLQWLKFSPQLRVICIEQNNFPESLKREFQKFGAAHTKLLVVV